MGTEFVNYTGTGFDWRYPDPKKIKIEDIAHHLSLINRFRGATKVPYSVAEHCTRMADGTLMGILPGHPLVNLLHDSAEAYLQDMIRPMKKDLGWISYVSLMGGEIFEFYPFSSAEEDILDVIYEGLGLPVGLRKEYPDWKEADCIMLVTECRDLMHSDCSDPDKEAGRIWKPFFDKFTPLGGEIVPWCWKEAEEKFLTMFDALHSDYLYNGERE